VYNSADLAHFAPGTPYCRHGDVKFKMFSREPPAVCDTKIKLLKAFGLAAVAYADVASIIWNSLRNRTPGYFTLNVSLEQARLLCQQTRADYDTHVAEHGCEMTLVTNDSAALAAALAAPQN
jgi:hypothetical protein